MRYFIICALALTAACVQTPKATPDMISYDYNPAFRTKFLMRQSAIDHCQEYGKTALLLSDEVKNDSSGDRIVTFKCVDPKAGS